jgi:hypothetical protein
MFVVVVVVVVVVAAAAAAAAVHFVINSVQKLLDTPLYVVSVPSYLIFVFYQWAL